MRLEDWSNAALRAAVTIRSEACAACGEAHAASELKRCSRCGLLWYCSHACLQRAHWKAAHRAQCRPGHDLRAGDIVTLLSVDGCEGVQDER
jgi:MYND finger